MDLQIPHAEVTYVIPDERSITFRPTGNDEWVLELHRLHGYGTEDAAVGLIRAVVLGAIAGGLKDEVGTAYLEGMAAEAKAERQILANEIRDGLTTLHGYRPGAS